MKSFTLCFVFPLIRLLLLITLFFSYEASSFCKTVDSLPGNPEYTVNAGDTSRCRDQADEFVRKLIRFDHAEDGLAWYSVKLILFPSEFERLFFYEEGRNREIYIAEKGNFHNDSAFFTTGFDKEQAQEEFRELYLKTRDAASSWSDASKKKFVRSSPFYPTASAENPGGQDSPASNSVVCSAAQVACSGNTYTFPSGTTGTAPPPVAGYPNYGCLLTRPGPAFYYMQVGVAGNIIISISQSANHDVDFVCWGPFTSLTDGCATGLTGICPCCSNVTAGCTYPKGNMVDCSYSPSPTETCTIQNAQVGEIYVLLITNFSQLAGTITFSQTGGTGVTNCNIVQHCSMIAMTQNVSACNGATNTFSVSGNIEFTNPSPTGTLTITDITAVPQISQIFSTPPFISPLAYSITNIPCDGSVHDLTAVFSDSLNCNISKPFTAPPALCPQAHISGGGSICNDGVQQVTVTVNFPVGLPPFTFVYAIDGTSQPPVVYNNLAPCQIFTTTPGVYTLVSVSTQGCQAGSVSGNAVVAVNPLPTATISGTTATCVNSASPVITLTGSSGTSPYTFIYNLNGGPNQTVTTTSGNSVAITVPTSVAGIFHYTLVSVQEGSSLACSQLQTGTATVTVNPLPTASIGGTTSVCKNDLPPLITFTGGTSEAPYTFSYNINGGTTLTVTTSVGNSVTVPAPTNVAGVFTYNLIGVLDGSVTGCFQLQPGNATITVHALPVPVISGPAALCQNVTGNYSTDAGMSGYTWTVPPGGSVISGTSSGTISILWTAAGAKTITVNYSNTNGCTGAAATNYGVTVNPLPVTTISENPDPVCQSLSHSYQVPSDPSCSYTWSILPSANGTVVSGQGTHAISINWINSGNATVSVTGTNTATCLSSSSLVTDVKPKPIPAFIPCFDVITTPNARKIILRGGTPSLPSQGVYSGSHVTLNAVTGNYEFDTPSAGTGIFPVVYTYTNTYGCPASAAPVNITVQIKAFQCGQNLTDVRDGKNYKTALFAGQCWMIQNLNYGTALVTAPVPSQSDNCLPEKYCNPADAGCTTYGGLYQWDELMDYASVAGTKGLCPPEWHIPNESEWQQLIDNLVVGITAPDANGIVGAQLKDPLILNGFHAFPGGLNYLDFDWAFSSGPFMASMYWTSANAGANQAVARGLNTYIPSISNYHSSRANAFFARCLKD